MKAELIPAVHSNGVDYVYEVWHDGAMIATIYAADGPGVRIVSKFNLEAGTPICPTLLPIGGGTDGLAVCVVSVATNKKGKFVDSNPAGRFNRGSGV